MSKENQATTNKDSTEEQVLPEGWTKGFSKSQQRYYYCHLQAKLTQWHFPTNSEVKDPYAAKQRQKQQQHGKGQQKSMPGSSSKRSSTGKPDESSNRKRSGVSEEDNSQMKKSKPNRMNSTSTSINTSSSLNNNTEMKPCVAIIVPFRDIHPAQNRAKHLSQFVPHMQSFLQRQISKGILGDYHIYIVEQSNDDRKFNRGKLLNIGYDLACKGTCRGRPRPTSSTSGSGVTASASSVPKMIPHTAFNFHDVDLLPGDDLGLWYCKYPKAPIHIARVWDRYSNNPKYFGGIVSFSSTDMKRINGYPNTFWGWGGEDDEMQKRCERLDIKWTSPPSGSITDLEQMNLKEKLNFLRSNKSWKCMVKWEALDEHEATWQTNGLKDLSYRVISFTDIDKSPVPRSNGGGGCSYSRATKILVDVQLNGNHWANDKCGIDYMPGK